MVKECDCGRFETVVKTVAELWQTIHIIGARSDHRTSGLGNRYHDPTPAYSGSFRPPLAKSYEKLDFGWSRLE